QEIIPDLIIDSAVFSELASGEKAQSPGMKYKHYAPEAEVVLLRGSLENAVKYIDKYGNAESVAVCFTGEKNSFSVPAVEYGLEDDGLSLASNLFYVLRKVDDLGFSRAFVRCPKPVGLGLAVYNRLLRSASFHVVDVDKRLPVIGLTGPTGAGKSTVAKYFVENGFYLIDGDILAREAVKNSAVLANLAKEFGSDIINEDGSLNRRLTADRAFATPEKTRALNAITHPTITALTYIEITRADKSDSKGVIIDAAALLQSPIINMCDMLVCVIAPKEERIRRIVERDGITEEQALTRIGAQKPEQYYIDNTDYMISNAKGEDFRAKADEIIARAFE
ncbi:MAG: dephospho-CoA kinase, partial [Clostridia bacterium]|nr:dephospho-CoA kinase [Clostridia bacterium]